ncbi:hypothetical protein U1Q18_022674, partial [Sarracenia purpurea var. burkii]
CDTIGRDYSIKLAYHIWFGIMTYSRHPPGTPGIPYASLISQFCIAQYVHLIDLKPTMFPPTAITWKSLTQSAPRFHHDTTTIPLIERIQSAPSPLEPAFSSYSSDC